MSSSTRLGRGAIERWLAPLAVALTGAVFFGALVHGILAGNETAHDLDRSDPVLDAALVALAEHGGTAAIAELPTAEPPPDWEIVCYVERGQWVSKALARDLGGSFVDYAYVPQNRYVVDDYWDLAFVDVEGKGVRVIELRRDPVATIEGPHCLSRDDARVAAHPIPGGSRIALTFVGRPARLN